MDRDRIKPEFQSPVHRRPSNSTFRSPSPSHSVLLPSYSGNARLTSQSSNYLATSCSSRSLVSSNSGKALVLSSSGKLMDQMGKKKYVTQVSGRHNDTELHLAAKRGDLDAVRQILGEIDAQMMGTANGAEFDSSIVDILSSVANEVNDLGETPLFSAAEKGFVNVVEELLKYSTKEGIVLKNKLGFDALHVAAIGGHQAVVQVLLEHDPGLSKTFGQSNATPLISAASRGHSGIVKELLLNDPSLVVISRSNGKNALHLASRQGHVDVVKQLLDYDPQLARRMDKKGQTALHMAVKGTSFKVVRLLLSADSALVTLPDKFGNLPLHVASRKKRLQTVKEVLQVAETDVNGVTREGKTSVDIAESLPLSEEREEVKECLRRHGGLRAEEVRRPREELRKTMREIRKDVRRQVEQARRTNMNMTGIATELRKLHQEGINNATNSVTVVAVLFATVAFSAIFTVPGGDGDDGVSVVVGTVPFKVFFVADAVALFTSLAVVVVQMTVVRGETKSATRVVEVINKLMWMASICTTLAFISSSYIVVGRRNRWAAFFVTAVGALTMGGVLATMTYYVLMYNKVRRARRKDRGNCSHHSPCNQVNTIFAI